MNDGGFKVPDSFKIPKKNAAAAAEGKGSLPMFSFSKKALGTSEKPAAASTAKLDFASSASMAQTGTVPKPKTSVPSTSLVNTVKRVRPIQAQPQPAAAPQAPDPAPTAPKGQARPALYKGLVDPTKKRPTLQQQLLKRRAIQTASRPVATPSPERRDASPNRGEQSEARLAPPTAKLFGDAGEPRPRSVSPQTGHKMGSEAASIIHQLQALLGRRCNDDYERYQLLDDRDKLLHKLRALDPPTSRVGNCPDLCPEKERYIRIVQKRLSGYECDSDGHLIPEKAVKEYGRSAADQERPLKHELRPGPMLVQSMDYLLTEIFDSNPPPDQLAGWYDFLWSRTRAIRKELTQQAIIDSTAVMLTERCARFHLFAAYALCTLDIGQFDQNMNTENLGKSLQSLRHLYDDLRKKGIHCENESEFRAYDIMMHLHDTNTLTQALSYRREVRESPQVRLALDLAKSMQNGNYARFFRLLRTKASFLQTTVCHRNFEKVRVRAYGVMVAAYPRGSLFNGDHVARLLGYDHVEQLAADVKLYGLLCEGDGLDLNKSRFNDRPDEPPAPRHYAWVEAKMGGLLLSQVIAGGDRVHRPRIGHVVDSFDANGCYTKDPVLAAAIGSHAQIASHVPIYQPMKNVEEVDQQTLLEQQKLRLEDERRRLQEAKAKQMAKKAMISDTCNEFFATEARQVFENSVVVKVAQQVEHRLQAAAERCANAAYAEACQIAAKREVEEQKRMAAERRQRLRREGLQAFAEVFDENRDSLVNRKLVMMVQPFINTAFRDSLIELTEKLGDKIQKRLKDRHTDKETRQIVEETLAKRKALIARKSTEIQTNLRQMWLRQFTDRWRAFVEEKKAKRIFLENVKRRIEEHRQNSSALASSVTNKFGYSKKSVEDFHKRRRAERLVRKYFLRWRAYAFEKGKVKRIGEFFARKRVQKLDEMAARPPVTKKPLYSRKSSICEFTFAAPVVHAALPLTADVSGNGYELSASNSYGSTPFGLANNSVLEELDLDWAREQVDRVGWTNVEHAGEDGENVQLAQHHDSLLSDDLEKVAAENAADSLSGVRDEITDFSSALAETNRRLNSLLNRYAST
ncbi:unnamed protein product, partial [Mesorhabditis spiculigera]